MSLSRGFCRLLIAVSIVLFGVGVGLDVLFNGPGWIARVSLEDGREVTLHFAGSEKSTVDQFRHESDERAKRGKIEGAPAGFIPDIDIARSRELFWKSALSREMSKRVPRPETVDVKTWNAVPGRQWVLEAPETLGSGAAALAWFLEIASVRVSRDWWSWSTAPFSLAASGLIGFLWTLFFTVGWVARGFSESV